MKRLLPIGGGLIIASVWCACFLGLVALSPLLSIKWIEVLCDGVFQVMGPLFFSGIGCLMVGQFFWHRDAALLSHRQKNLLCLACGYDLRGSINRGPAQCPECGRAFNEIISERDNVNAANPPDNC
ncbi:MAG: hypothetical protein WD768_09005 [Phycisphaeraceae bacterium]